MLASNATTVLAVMAAYHFVVAVKPDVVVDDYQPSENRIRQWLEDFLSAMERPHIASHLDRKFVDTSLNAPLKHAAG